MKFSVVIAAHNEGPQIASALKRLRQISRTSPMELIVVDGGSDDGTADHAAPWTDGLIRMESHNRGAQWHAGAAKATGDLLLFLRADSQPPGTWQQALERFWLEAPGQDRAAASFTVDYGAGAGLRLLSAWSNARARGGVIGADHGLCTTPEVYRAAGGFSPMPELEDLDFSRRLRARGRVDLLADVIHASGRRVGGGPLSYMAGRLWLETRYQLGAKPADLARR